MARRSARGMGAGLAPRLLVVAAATLWGTTGTTQALAPAAATPPTVGAARIVLGAVMLGLLARVLRGAVDLRGFLMPGRRAATLAAAVSMAAYQLCFFGGVARAGVAVGTIVGIGSAPVFTGLLGAAVRGERPGGTWYASTGLAVAGAGLLIGAGGGAGQPVQVLGVVLALGAGASYACYTVASKVLLDTGCAPVPTMAVTFGGGALLLVPVLVGGDLGWMTEPAGAGAVLWLGVATVALAYALFASGLRYLPAATVATLTLAEPLTAGTLGVVALGERPGVVAAVGAGALLLGLVLLTVRPLLAARSAVTEP